MQLVIFKHFPRNQKFQSVLHKYFCSDKEYSCIHLRALIDHFTGHKYKRNRLQYC